MTLPSLVRGMWRVTYQESNQTLLSYSWPLLGLIRSLVSNNLRKQRLIVIDWCCMCKRDGETTNHLLLHCFVAQELWSMLLLGVHRFMLKGVVKLLAS